MTATIPSQRPHSHLLRKGRHSQAGQIYLITTVTQGRVPVFTDLRCARALVLALRRSDAEKISQTLAWVIMPDHLHWLFTLGEGVPLSRCVGLVKGRSARMVNHLRAVQSSCLWQGGYHDHALRREEDLQQVARYVVANPLRAGLVERLGDYPHWDAVWLDPQ